MRPDPDSDPQLSDILLRAFPGSRIESRRELEGGVSARAVVVDLRLAGGAAERVVVRRPTADTPETERRVAESEFRLLHRCVERGLRTPRPRALDRQAAAVILEYVDGAPDLAVDGAPSRLGTVARELARVHASDAVDDLHFLERHADRTARAILEPPPNLDLALGEPRLRAVLSRLWPWPQHNPDALLHGDYWPGNLLWRSERLVAVLDWEDAAVGDPLADVAIARLDVLWVFGEAAMHEFTERYRERVRLDWRNLPRWDLCAALRPMSSLASLAPSYARPPMNRPDVTELGMRQGHRDFVAQALRALELQD